MQITLVQGLLIALLVFICAFDKHMETFMWFRPLVVAFFTGIILGDVRLGMQAGAVAELSYLGLLTVGGTVPPDPLFAGLMTTVLAYTTGCDVNTALGLAVPFALIGQWINTGTNPFYAGFLPQIDKCAAAGDEKGIAKVMYTGWILYAAMFALAAFLSTYALQSGISAFVAAFPEWLVHGFEVAGGLMPAVGLALLLVVMLKKENAAYLLAGFVIMVITNCQNILPIAVIAGCIAYVNFTRDMETAKLTAASTATAAQEGDFEDGI